MKINININIEIPNSLIKELGITFPKKEKVIDLWTKKNLDVTHYQNGDLIPLVTNNEEWSKLKTGARCYPDGNAEIVKKYGYIYNWYAVNDKRGLAPEGFHIPTDEEWKELEIYIGSNAGTKLKSTNGWNSDGNGTDDYGFTALPGGYRNLSGNYYYQGDYAFFWSATESSSYRAWSRTFYYNSSAVGRGYYYKVYGFSVRCIKDSIK